MARDGKLVYSRGYGYANLDYDIRITPQTLFDVASNTEQFVAANLGMLALEGKLSPDDDVRKWLPELPEYERPLTLRHMLHHTSGLPARRHRWPVHEFAAGHDAPVETANVLEAVARAAAGAR